MSKLAEFEKMKALFSDWAEHGVPIGIDYPKTQSEAVGWKNERFGITGVGSKSYFKTTHPEYGKIVKDIKELIARLTPENEVEKRKRDNIGEEYPNKTAGRVYKTQKARRIAAEDLSASLKAENISLLSQMHNIREDLSAARLALKIERQAAENLRSEKAKLEEDNAKLTRLLASRSGLFQVVE